jgi:hypothetical protein
LDLRNSVDVKQIANELLAHLSPGDEVAVTARHDGGCDNSAIIKLLDELKNRGFQVCLVHNPTGAQDFLLLEKGMQIIRRYGAINVCAMGGLLWKCLCLAALYLGLSGSST